MKNPNDHDEEEILRSYEQDEWVSVRDFKKLREEYAAYAHNTFKKNKRINIRISESDLSRLKAKSLEEGIPYQTLVSSLIHRYVTGKISS
ncbi:antitoxin [Prosthecochloris sp. GSB1]|nr:antitoxin [Prosthecochloris sp. GSB1]